MVEKTAEILVLVVGAQMREVVVLVLRVVGMVFVLLLLDADRVLGLVEEGLVGVGGVLLAGDLVRGGLRGRLLGVGDGVTGRELVGVAEGKVEGRGGER